MSRRRVGWALIGAGWVARDYFVPALVASPHDRAVAVYDPNPGAAHRAAALSGGSVADSLAAAVNDPGVDAVYVATPNDAHAPAVRVAASAGKAVLCEKPLAASLEDAAALVADCRDTGVLAGCAFDQRWHPAHRRLAALIRDGRLGTVTAVRIVYGCWLPSNWSANNWRIDPMRAGGGACVDLAPHGIDLVGVLLEDDLVDARTMLQRRVHDYPVDDGATLIGRTASGVLVNLHVSYNTPGALPRRRLEIIGTRAQAVAMDTMGQTSGGTLRLIDSASGVAHSVPFDAASSPFDAQLTAFSAAVRGEQAWPYPLDRDLALLTLLHDAAEHLEVVA